MGEARRLINAADKDLRPLLRAALLTGARYAELAAMDVSSFNSDAGTVFVAQSKNGRPRHIHLNDEGVVFFKAHGLGRAGKEPMFVKATGGRWQKNDQTRPMERACTAAKITPRATFHTLRHSWASLAVMGGMPLHVVAANLGHTSIRMVESTYGHLSGDYLKTTIRRTAPRFGFKADRKVVGL